jgi:hypothetical protein
LTKRRDAPVSEKLMEQAMSAGIQALRKVVSNHRIHAGSPPRWKLKAPLARLTAQPREG